MPAKILLVNGPNLNKLGSREPDIYGHTTLEEIIHESIEQAHKLGMELECMQSNHEGEIIDLVHQAQGRVQGLIINAGALTHTSVALMDALLTLYHTGYRSAFVQPGATRGVSPHLLYQHGIYRLYQRLWQRKLSPSTRSDGRYC
jgi:hypothetical protein